MTKQETLEYENLKQKKNLTDSEAKRFDYLDNKFKLEYFKEELKNEKAKKNPDKKYIKQLEDNIQAHENSKHKDTVLFAMKYGKDLIVLGILLFMVLKGKK